MRGGGSYLQGSTRERRRVEEYKNLVCRGFSFRWNSNLGKESFYMSFSLAADNPTSYLLRRSQQSFDAQFLPDFQLRRSYVLQGNSFLLRKLRKIFQRVKRLQISHQETFVPSRFTPLHKDQLEKGLHAFFFIVHAQHSSILSIAFYKTLRSMDITFFYPSSCCICSRSDLRD